MKYPLVLVIVLSLIVLAYLGLSSNAMLFSPFTYIIITAILALILFVSIFKAVKTTTLRLLIGGFVVILILVYLMVLFWVLQDYGELPYLQTTRTLTRSDPYPLPDNDAMWISVQAPWYLHREDTGSNARPLLVSIYQETGIPHSFNLQMTWEKSAVFVTNAAGDEIAESIPITTTPGLTNTVMFHATHGADISPFDAAVNGSLEVIYSDNIPHPVLSMNLLVEGQRQDAWRAFIDRLGQELFPWAVLGLAGFIALGTKDWLENRQKVASIEQRLSDHMVQHSISDPGVVATLWDQYQTLAEQSILVSSTLLETEMRKACERQALEQCEKAEWSKALEILKRPRTLNFGELEDDLKRLAKRDEQSDEDYEGTPDDLKLRGNELSSICTRLNDNSRAFRMLIAISSHVSKKEIRDQAEMLVGKKEYLSQLLNYVETKSDDPLKTVLIVQLKQDPKTLHELVKSISEATTPLDHRVHAIEILSDAGTGDIDPWEALGSCLSDSSPELRHAAANALGELKVGEAIPKLQEMARKDPMFYVRIAAEGALTTLGAGVPSRLIAPNPALSQWLRKHLVTTDRIEDYFQTNRAEDEIDLVKFLTPIELINTWKIKEPRSQAIFTVRGGGKTWICYDLEKELAASGTQLTAERKRFAVYCSDWSHVHNATGTTKPDLYFYDILYAAVQSLLRYLLNNSKQFVPTEYPFGMSQPVAERAKWLMIRFLGEQGLHARLGEFLINRQVRYSPEFLQKRHSDDALEDVTARMNPRQRGAAETVAWILSLEASTTLTGSSSVGAYMTDFGEIVRALNFDEVWVLADNLDTTTDQLASDYTGSHIAHLFASRHLIFQPGFIFKFLVPDEWYSALMDYCDYSSGGLESVVYSWPNEKLKELVDTRAQGLGVQTLTETFSGINKDKIELEILDRAKGSPAQIIRIVEQILQNASRRWSGGSDEPITKDDFPK